MTRRAGGSRHAGTTEPGHRIARHMRRPSSEATSCRESCACGRPEAVTAAALPHTGHAILGLLMPVRRAGPGTIHRPAVFFSKPPAGRGPTPLDVRGSRVFAGPSLFCRSILFARVVELW